MPLAALYDNRHGIMYDTEWRESLLCEGASSFMCVYLLLVSEEQLLSERYSEETISSN